MNKLLNILGLTLGSWAGWALGEHISLGAAVIGGAIGTGVGLYLARRIAQEYF